jgi:hypothetical protein
MWTCSHGAQAKWMHPVSARTHHLAACLLSYTCAFARGFSWHVENIDDWSDCPEYDGLETVHGRL